MRRLAPTFPAKCRHVLELGGARLLHEKSGPIAQVVDKGRGILPARHVSHAGQDRIHPPRRNRRHHLVETGLLPVDLDAELLAERLAEFDVEAGQRVGRGIAEFHRRIVRYDGNLDTALLGDFRRQLDRHDRSENGASERGSENPLHHDKHPIRSPRKERIEYALHGACREPPPQVRTPRSRHGPYRRPYPLPRAQNRVRASPPSSSCRCALAPS